MLRDRDFCLSVLPVLKMSRLNVMLYLAVLMLSFVLIASQMDSLSDSKPAPLQFSRSQHIDTYPPPERNYNALHTYQSTAEVQAANIHRASSLPSRLDSASFPPPFLRRHRAQQGLHQKLQRLHQDHALRNADFSPIHANAAASQAIEAKTWRLEALESQTRALELHTEQYPGHVGLALQQTHALWDHAEDSTLRRGTPPPASLAYQEHRQAACFHWAGAAAHEGALRRAAAGVRAAIRGAEAAARSGFPAARRGSTELAVGAALRALATAQRALRLEGASFAMARARVELRRADELCRPMRRLTWEETSREDALGREAIVRRYREARERGGAHVLVPDAVQGGLKPRWAYHGVLQGRSGRQVGGSLAAAWADVGEGNRQRDVFWRDDHRRRDDKWAQLRRHKSPSRSESPGSASSDYLMAFQARMAAE